MTKTVLQSQTWAFYAITDEQEGRVLEKIGRGELVLFDDGSVQFFRKKLFGGYDDEPEHWYSVSDIMDNATAYSDGLEVEVYFPATENQTAEVTTFFYELNEDESTRWEEALPKPKSKPQAEAPQQAAVQPQVTKEIIREKEVIQREIVKVRCRHCKRLYDEVGDYCPYCGAPNQLPTITSPPRGLPRMMMVLEQT